MSRTAAPPRGDAEAGRVPFAVPELLPETSVQPCPLLADVVLERRLRATATGAGALEHLVALQRIADATGGNRASPGPGYDASVQYVVDSLSSAGYDVSTPAYPLPKRRRRSGETCCRNVIAQTRTGDRRRVVVLGAHLDSVRKGPGINGNGSGVAALLEIATRLGGSPPVRNVVRFAFWGSEEDDLEGSTHYVDTLSRAERDDILLYLNLDMLASPNPGYFVLGGEGRSRSEHGPPGSAQVVWLLVEQLAATGVVARTVPLDRESDHVPFVDAGIPSAGVWTGDRGTKTRKQARRWGGRPGRPFDPYYHTARDRLDTIDRTALDHVTRAVAGAVCRVAVSLGTRPGS